MKTNRNLRLIRTLAVAGLLGLLPLVSQAKEGPGSGGGGDLMMISQNKLELRERAIFLRTGWVRDFISNEERGLKARLLTLIDSLNPEKVRVATSRIPKKYERIRKVLTSGREEFKADIRNSHWELSEQDFTPWCGEMDGKVKDAATCGEERSIVRFNYHRIARYKVSREELRHKLIQLAFHEHVRHFGFPDNDNVLAELAGVIEDNDALVTYEESVEGDRMPFKRAMLIVLENLPWSWAQSASRDVKKTNLYCKTPLGQEPCPDAQFSRVGYTFTSSDIVWPISYCRDVRSDLLKAGYSVKAVQLKPGYGFCENLFNAWLISDISDRLTLGDMAGALVKMSTRAGK